MYFQAFTVPTYLGNHCLPVLRYHLESHWVVFKQVVGKGITNPRGPLGRSHFKQLVASVLHIHEICILITLRQLLCPRCACASEVYGSMFVCVCVVLQLLNDTEVQVKVSIGF